MNERYTPNLGQTSISIWKNEKYSKGGKLPYFRGTITIPADARAGQQYDVSFWVNDTPKNERSPHLTGRVAEPYKKTAAPRSEPQSRPAADDLDLPF